MPFEKENRVYKGGNAGIHRVGDQTFLQLPELNPWQNMVMALYALGLKNREIAETLKVTYISVTIQVSDSRKALEIPQESLKKDVIQEIVKRGRRA